MRLNKAMLAAFGAALVAGLTTGGVAAWAYWSQEFSGSAVSNQFGTPVIQECPLGSDSCTTAGSSNMVDGKNLLDSLAFTPADASTMDTALAGDPTAKPTVVKGVTLKASGLLGNQGLDYSWAAPSADSATWASGTTGTWDYTWAGQSTFALWESPTSGTCNASDAAANPLPASGTLVDSKYQNTNHAGKAAVDLTICASWTFNGAGSYENTATATQCTDAGASSLTSDGACSEFGGTDSKNQSDTDTDSWSATLLPDASSEPTTAVPITVEVTTGTT
jgi:hypothetical protein